jgi:hypothetical protein
MIFLFNLSRGTRQLQTYIPSVLTATTNPYGLQIKSSPVVCYNSSAKYFDLKRIKGWSNLGHYIIWIFENFILFICKGKVITIKAVEALRVARVWDSHIFQTFGSQMAARLSALRAGRLLLPRRFLVLISVRGSVDPRAIVRLDG